MDSLFLGQARELTFLSLCVEPLYIASVNLMKGEATHLGRFTGSGISYSFDFTLFPVVHILARLTYTAANGDTLNVDLAEDYDLSIGLHEGTVIFTGGTGRFEDASGGGWYTAIDNPDGTESTVDSEYTISY